MCILFITLQPKIFHLATDTGINEITVTGDSKKQISFCTHFALQWSIDQLMHYTETSSSMFDKIFVNNNNNLLLSGIGVPVLYQELTLSLYNS